MIIPYPNSDSTSSQEASWSHNPSNWKSQSNNSFLTLKYLYHDTNNYLTQQDSNLRVYITQE